MTLLYQTEQIRQLEELVFDTGSCKPFDLMQLAGQAVFDEIKARYADAKHLLVYCGKGNNGADGLVVAVLAKQAGLKVQVQLVVLQEVQEQMVQMVMQVLMVKAKHQVLQVQAVQMVQVVQPEQMVKVRLVVHQVQVVQMVQQVMLEHQD